jgi:hypothetical protein
MKQVIINSHATIVKGPFRGVIGRVVGFDSDMDMVSVEVAEDTFIDVKSGVIKRVPELTKTKAWDLVMSFFEVGKKYKIGFTDLEGNDVEHKCIVFEKNGGNLGIQVFETDGEPDEGQTWIKWSWMNQIEGLL